MTSPFQCLSLSWRHIAVGLAIFAITGCRVGPNYHPPAVPIPPAFQEATANSNLPPLAGSDWWTVFEDATLTDLERQAVAANLDVRIASTHIDQADAYRRSIRSQEFPQISANPSISRTREAQDRPNNGNTSGKAATYNDLQLPLILNYEIDAWGRIRRLVASAQAAQQATQADLNFTRLTATAAVAINYFTLREADTETAIVQSTIVDLQRGYEITDNQFRRGLVSELASAQAETILDQTNARVEALHIQRAQSEHAIAALLGRPVEGFSIEVIPTLSPPPAIPPGMPADVLRRRPDVISAERNEASASEQIGVAQAAYFPQLSLSGLTGFESANPGAIFTWQNTIASLAAGAAAPIFTGGRLRANVDQAKANYQQSELQYQKTVVTSYQEVEDQLASLHYLANEYQSEEKAVTDASRAEKIANNRYQAGLVGYLDVVYAQQTLLQNQETTQQVQGQRLISTVSLIRALGGGW